MTASTEVSARPGGAAFLALSCVGFLATAPALAQDREDGPRLGGVVVTDTVVEDEGYRAERASNPLLPGPLRDVPRTVTVLDRQLLEDQAAVTFADALRNVPGITLGQGEGGAGSGDFVNLRGFDASNDIAIDGFADRLQYSRSDVFNVERLEVYKGPNTALSGAGGAAGLINLVSKRATQGDFVRANFSLGNRDWKRATFDGNVSLDGLGGAALRLNLMAHDQDVARRDFITQRRFGIAPSVSVGLNGPTRATVSLHWQEDDNLPDYGIPLLVNGTRPAPISNYYGWRNIDREEQQVTILSLFLEHDFSPNVTLANATRYGVVDRDAVWSTPRPTSAANLNAAAARIAAGDTANAFYIVGGPQGFGRISQNTVLANRVTLTVDTPELTGGIGNVLVVGGEISRETLERNQINTTGLAGAQRNLFAPVPDFSGPISQTRTFGQYDVRAERAGAFLFDTVSFGDIVQLNLGGRYERFDVRLGGTAYAALTDRTSGEDLWSWQAGLVLKPVETASLYASYSDAKQPQALTATSTGTVSTANLALPALKNENYEIGAKWDVLDEALSLTAALFRNERVNQPILFGPEILLAGRQRVQGVELGATGRLTDDWQLFAAYAYLDSTIIRAASNQAITEGEELTQTPTHSATLWTSYATPFGLRVGAGANYMGERVSRNSTAAQAAWRLDDYVLLNAMAEYSITPQIAVQVNANNIGNARFINRIRANDGYVIAVPGEGRTVMATLRYTY